MLFNYYDPVRHINDDNDIGFNVVTIFAWFEYRKDVA